MSKVCVKGNIGTREVVILSVLGLVFFTGILTVLGAVPFSGVGLSNLMVFVMLRPFLYWMILLGFFIVARREKDKLIARAAVIGLLPHLLFLLSMMLFPAVMLAGDEELFNTYSLYWMGTVMLLTIPVPLLFMAVNFSSMRKDSPPGPLFGMVRASLVCEFFIVPVGVFLYLLAPVFSRLGIGSIVLLIWGLVVVFASFIGFMLQAVLLMKKMGWV